MEVGERLFAQNGYGGTSIADIAKAADVAVGSVYRLFPDKPSLLAALHKRVEDRFIAVMIDAWASVEPYDQKFGPLISALLSEAERVQDIMPLYAMTKDMIGIGDYVPGSAMIATMNKLYSEGVKARAFREIPSGILGPLAHSMVEGGMRAWMLAPTRDNRLRVKEHLLKVFERAFLVSS